VRIRTTKPEFWRSEDIAALSIEDRLLFMGVWSYVDDNGVGKDSVPILAAELFAHDLARDPRETLARVTGGLARLAEAGLVLRYVVAGRAYLYVTNWRHQKIDHPASPRYPHPNGEVGQVFSPSPEELAIYSREVREVLAPVTGEQGNRGTGEKEPRRASRKPRTPTARAEDDPAFMEFWEAYGYKVDRADAFDSWLKIPADVERAVVIDGARRYVTWLGQHPDPPSQKHAATFLNKRGWESEFTPPRRRGEAPPPSVRERWATT
jgi:hypothetical protein